jgi:hypothetical protein
MRGTCVDIFLFPSHAGGMQYPRPMSILWEATSRHIERAFRHDDVARQIIRKELEDDLRNHQWVSFAKQMRASA